MLSASEADVEEQFSDFHREYLAEGRNSQTTPKPLEEEQFGPNRGPFPLPSEAWKKPKEPSRKLEEALNEEEVP